MNINQDHIRNLSDEGVAIVPSILSDDLVTKLLDELTRSIQEDSLMYPDVFDKGMVHNCMVRGKEMALLLDNEVMNNYLINCFAETCILYAYQSSSLLPKKGNYGSRIHVDSPRFIPGYDTNMGVMFPLNDFTIENGATYYLPGSHKSSRVPSEEEFYANAKRVCCNAGDMILINTRVFHAAGRNDTSSARHALTMNFCRSYMRQRFDFVRLVPDELIEQLGSNGRRLIGMDVRMPTCLEEFYLPEEERLYKPGQG